MSPQIPLKQGQNRRRGGSLGLTRRLQDRRRATDPTPARTPRR